MNPAEAHWLESSIKFREAVAKEFECLVRDGASVAEIPEVEESELDAIEVTYANAQP